MSDKPVAAKILLTLRDRKATGEEFVGLSETLYQQNLIYSQPRELRRNNNTLELTVTFRDVISFKSWNNNKAIKGLWHIKFSELLSEKPNTIEERCVIIEVDNYKNCTCEKSDFYILQGRYLQFIDELTCNKCLGQIPYSKIPIEIEIEEWQRNYQRIYLNWLDSGIFEKSAFNELTSYKKGKLNLEGQKIRKQLSEFFKIPVYLSYFTDESNNNNCLICGQQGIDSDFKPLNKICKKCNTAYSYIE